MSNLILDRFRTPFILCNRKGNQTKSIYMYPDEEKSCLQVAPVKQVSLCEVFQKARHYLIQDVRAAETSFGVEKQIIDLGYLLKDARELIVCYRKKSNTHLRRLLKLINAHAPQILKNCFPHIFNNKCQETEQKTQKAYYQYCACIKQLQKELLISVKPKNEAKPILEDVKIIPKPPILPKGIDCLPDDVMRKIFIERLDKKDKICALKVCKNWHQQFKKTTDLEILHLHTLLASFMVDLNGEQFKPVIEKFEEILKDKEVNSALITSFDRTKLTQRNLYNIFKRYRLLLNDHTEIVKAAVSYSGEALQFASLRLKGNADIVKIAVAQDGESLVDASEALKNNAEIVRIAVTQDGRALLDASDELKGNPEIVKIAVTQNGWALQYASAQLRGNADIVKMALSQNGLALRFALKELKNNAEIVEIAVAKDGGALKYASPNLRDDVEVVKIAVTQKKSALKFASDRLQNHAEIVRIATTHN